MRQCSRCNQRGETAEPCTCTDELIAADQDVADLKQQLAAAEQRAAHAEEEAMLVYAENTKLKADMQGPHGYATWKDAAVAERIARVKAEREVELYTAQLEVIDYLQEVADKAKDDLSKAQLEFAEILHNKQAEIDRMRDALESIAECKVTDCDGYDVACSMREEAGDAIKEGQ